MIIECAYIVITNFKFKAMEEKIKKLEARVKKLEDLLKLQMEVNENQNSIMKSFDEMFKIRT